MNTPGLLGRSGVAKQKPHSRLVLFLGVMYLLSLGSRVPALLFAPRGFLYNTDEMDMTLRSLDSFLGLPAVGLTKPGTTLNLLCLPVYVADFLAASHVPRTFAQGMSLFAGYLSHAYADPRHSVLIMRWVVALVCSACPLLGYYLGVRLSKSHFMGFACALLLSFQPTFYQHSVMATGDAVAITLALAGILCLLPQTDLHLATAAGFLFSGALATKITVASLVVLPLLLILLHGSQVSLRQRGLALLRFCGSLAVGFMLWCPYVWTDPVRLGKTVIGAVTRPGSAPSLTAFLLVWSDGMGITFSVLTLLAIGCGICLILFRQQTRLVIASFAALVAILTPLFLSATNAFPRYFLPTLPCVVILLAAGVRIFESEQPLLRRWRAPALALALLAGLTVCGETWAQELPLRGPDELAAAVGVIQSLPKETTLFLPEEALSTFQVPLSQRACQELLEGARHHLESEDGVIKFAETRGVPSASARVFLWSLNEREQADYRRWAAACTVEWSGSRAIFFYYPPYDPHDDPRRPEARRISHATMDLVTAIRTMQRTDDAAILAPSAVASLGRPLWSGERWHWYRR